MCFRGGKTWGSIHFSFNLPGNFILVHSEESCTRTPTLPDGASVADSSPWLRAPQELEEQ